MSTRVTSTRLIGRERELAELEAALADAASGRASLAFIAGESGVGKSRLTEELAARARAAGARVLSGDSVELGDGELPYAPIVAALRPLVRAGDPALDSLGRPDRAALTRLFPSLADEAAPPVALADATAQAQLFEALLALLAALGAERPVVLAIEDLHWADRSTRSFLAFLGRTLCAERVLLLATYRSDELHRRHPLRPVLAELERDSRARRIELAALSREELAAQLTDILGAAPERALADRLWARAGGNPLFTEELLAAGLDGRGAPPATLREALMVRVERLSEHAQELLRLLAAGQRLDHDLLADASGLDPVVLRDALREAVAGHIVVADAEGVYAFRHALLREVVHDDLLPGEHAELHRALAVALERRIDAGRASVHLTAAAAHHHHAAGDRAAALCASVRAATAAEGVHAHGEALALLERALELWPGVEDAAERVGADHAGILSRAAHAAEMQGELHRQEAFIEAALREVDEEREPHRAARLLERLARGQRRLGRSDESLETIRRGRALLPEGEGGMADARLISLEAKVRMLNGRYRESARTAREALAAARSAQDPVAESRALNVLGVSLAHAGDLEAGTAALGEALEIAERDGRPAEHTDAYCNLADILFIHGRDAEALSVARAGLAHEGLPRYATEWLRAMVAEIAFQRGDWDEAAANLPGPERRLVGAAAVNVGMRRAELALGRGDLVTTRAELDAIAATVEESSDSQFHGHYGALRAELERHAGDLPAARRAIDEGLDRIEFCSDDAIRLGQLAAVGVGVEADITQQARDLGDIMAVAASQERAQALLERVEAAAEEARAVVAAQLAGARADMARVLGRPDPALAAAAAEAWDALARPYPAAAARLREAEALVELGERDAAAVAVRRAHAEAVRLGAGALRAELEGLAARARLDIADAPETPAEPAAELPFGLTPRELQVLSLVARGATNREIGAELFMAEKTASVHVSRILSKLDVRSRTEAAAVAHRQGLGSALV
jgi:DNA-binding NarL/FixJ family response regulator/tetratricopeptide (TPR) repeat protein